MGPVPIIPGPESNLGQSLLFEIKVQLSPEPLIPGLRHSPTVHLGLSLQPGRFRFGSLISSPTTCNKSDDLFRFGPEISIRTRKNSLRKLGLWGKTIVNLIHSFCKGKNQFGLTEKMLSLLALNGLKVERRNLTPTDTEG